MNVLHSLVSLRWGYGVGVLLLWVATFFVLAWLSAPCPPGHRSCHPLYKPTCCATLTITALFFLAVVFSETVRRAVIHPKRRNFYDERAFYAVALLALGLDVAYLFFT